MLLIERQKFKTRKLENQSPRQPFKSYIRNCPKRVFQMTGVIGYCQLCILPILTWPIEEWGQNKSTMITIYPIGIILVFFY